MSMPTGVSGPGALSQRTDLQPASVPTGMDYGAASAMAQSEQSAPMPQDPNTPAASPGGLAAGAPAMQSGPQISPPPTLDTPSQRPGEPVTHGADAGPGASSAILNATPGAPAAGGQISSAIATAAASDPSGLLARLGMIAQQRGL